MKIITGKKLTIKWRIFSIISILIMGMLIFGFSSPVMASEGEESALFSVSSNDSDNSGNSDTTGDSNIVDEPSSNDDSLGGEITGDPDGDTFDTSKTSGTDDNDTDNESGDSPSDTANPTDGMNHEGTSSNEDGSMLSPVNPPLNQTPFLNTRFLMDLPI